MKSILILCLTLGMAFCPPARAAGRQLTGPHAPASSPALTPQDAVQRFHAQPGFEVRLFASEPEVVNPVAMTWDARGRLWVLELFEYPKGAKPGTRPRDRIKILEDIDADGRADRVTLFAGGLNLATGMLLGNGGVYVGQAPDLLFLEDTDGDDIADKRTRLLGGFGRDDRHELLNGFTWGPDGWLYLTQGVFTHSKVVDPGQPDRNPVIMNAAVARFHPRTKRFEVFADGTSNPWGVGFDRLGNAFVSACVIDHLFHMAPGGLYARQAGQPEYRYAYELLPSIVKHKHYRAAYCGVQIYESDQYPPAYRGRVLMGNIHANALNMDSLLENGSSFQAYPETDFLQSTDGWFRPVSEQTGPDGAIWIADWYDKYPCYQNAQADPEGVDRTFGRIWRVVYTGNEPGKPVPSRPRRGMNLAALPTPEMVGLLSHPNAWHRETAQRLLRERRDPQAKGLLEERLRHATHLNERLGALWVLHGSGQLDEAVLDALVNDQDFPLRLWTARLTGERADPAPRAIARLKQLASDTSAPVRLAVATALRQFVSSALTVNRPVPYNPMDLDLRPIFERLIYASARQEDPVIPFMIWMAAEPLIAQNPAPALDWLLDNGGNTIRVSGTLAYKTLRRICDTRDASKLERGVDFIDAAVARDHRLAAAAIDGILDGQKADPRRPTNATGAFFSRLLSHPDPTLRNRALRLGTLWGDETATAAIVSLIQDSSADTSQRRQAIDLAKIWAPDKARRVLLPVLETEQDPDLLEASIHALEAVGGKAVAAALIQAWPRLQARARQATAKALASRPDWIPPFLTAIERKTILPTDIPVTVIRTLARNREAAIRERARKAIGRFREPNADLAKIISQKKRVVLHGPVDLKAGRKVAETACLVCHKFYGKGAGIGPDLTGVGRANLDTLLANIIDPNQIVGNGYENVEIETKDDRVVSGRLLEQTDTFVKLGSAGPTETVVARNQIASLRKTESSVMPEGLEQMPDPDFRNLIWFILNPPEEHRPMTPQRRRALIGDASETPTHDFEAVALWNPDWKVISAAHAQAPAKLPAFAGRNNVLVTYPFHPQRGAALERQLTIPAGVKTVLSVRVAAQEGAKWVLRAFANQELVRKEIIDGHNGWKDVRIDLSRFAGQTIPVRLENYAYNMENDFGYWNDLEINRSKGSVR